jgi:hypothetical protein
LNSADKPAGGNGNFGGIGNPSVNVFGKFIVVQGDVVFTTKAPLQPRLLGPWLARLAAG